VTLGAVSALVALGLLGLLGRAIFEAAESAILWVNRRGLRTRGEDGDRAAARATEILAETPSILFATLIGSTLGLVVFTVAAMHLVLRTELVASPPAALLLTLVVLTPVVVILTGTLPKSIGRRRAEGTVLALTPPLAGMSVLLRPIERSVSVMSSAMAKLVGDEGGSPLWPVSGAELLEAVPATEPEDPFETDERQMIHDILRLDRTIVREVMRPLIHVVALAETELSQVHIAELARKTGHSRFPVYRTYIIDLIGHIDVYDVLHGGDKTPEEIRPLVHPPTYVPETKRVDDLLQEFLRERRRLAIVIDEHGACSGLVTLEDILEEIFGEIEDEFDHERPPWRTDEEGGIIFEAGVDLDDVNHHFGLAIPKTHSETLGGYVYESLGRVPRAGEAVEHGGRTLRVHEMSAQRIVRLRLEPPDTDAR
jgi:CBS domain containing-hemolysin-like protein